MEDKKLIYHFLKEDCSQEELDQLHEWLISDLDEETTNDVLKSLWKKTYDGNIHDLDEQNLSANIKNKIRANGGFSNEPDVTEDYNRARKKYTPLAIICVILLSMLGASFLITTNQQPEPILAAAVQQIEKSTTKGNRSSIMLRDGSKVTLNSETKITYGDDFGTSHRKIYLEGEAFFEVAHNEDLPFIVYSDNLITRALGTSFNVRDYKSEGNASIALATGVVKVKRNRKTTNKEKVILKPNEQIVVDKTSQTWSKSQYEALKVLSWKDNSLYFKDMDLSSIIKILERWYDVQIKVEGNSTEKLFYQGTGTFQKQSLENILNTLGFTMGFESTINDKQIIIKLTN